MKKYLTATVVAWALMMGAIATFSLLTSIIIDEMTIKEYIDYVFAGCYLNDRYHIGNAWTTMGVVTSISILISMLWNGLRSEK